jgi:hypothetical protein
MPDIGELVIGAWLSEVQGYDIVLYNRRPGRDLPPDIAPQGPTGVAARLSELDVLGLNTEGRTAYLAESTAHLGGFLIGKGTADGAAKLSAKFRVASAYGAILRTRLGMESSLALWSPRVPKAIESLRPQLEDEIGKSIEFVVNETYTERIVEVISRATAETRTTGNDFYRSLQLLAHLTKSPFIDLPKPIARQVAEAVKDFEAVAAALPTRSWAEVSKVHRTQRGIYAPRGGSWASVICNTGKNAPYPDQFVGSDVLRYIGWGKTGTSRWSATTSLFARRSRTGWRFESSRSSPRTGTPITATGWAENPNSTSSR